MVDGHLGGGDDAIEIVAESRAVGEVLLVRVGEVLLLRNCYLRSIWWIVVDSM